MIQATSYQISNMVNSATIQHGYGYQFWRFPENGFGCVGMGSQLAICLPERDLVFVTTGDTQELQQRQYAAYDLFYDLLLPQMKDEPLPVDESAAAELRALTENLSDPGRPRQRVLPNDGSRERQNVSHGPGPQWASNNCALILTAAKAFCRMKTHAAKRSCVSGSAVRSSISSRRRTIPGGGVGEPEGARPTAAQQAPHGTRRARSFCTVTSSTIILER